MNIFAYYDATHFMRYPIFFNPSYVNVTITCESWIDIIWQYRIKCHITLEQTICNISDLCVCVCVYNHIICMKLNFNDQLTKVLGTASFVQANHVLPVTISEPLSRFNNLPINSEQIMNIDIYTSNPLSNSNLDSGSQLQSIKKFTRNKSKA